MKKNKLLLFMIIMLIITLIIVYFIIRNKNITTSIETSGDINMKENIEKIENKNNNEKTKENDQMLLIYDIEEGYLTVPYNTLANKHNYNWKKLNNSNSSHYIYEDENYTSKLGIDVSSHQKDIDWEAVKNAGVEFAILRLGYRGYGQAGRVLLDDYFEQNYENAKNQGIEIGVYFFSQAINIDEIKYEAEFVLENIKGKDIKYPIVFDLENIKNDTARTDNLTEKEINNFAIEFCRIIREAGYKPCIYGNSKTFTTKMQLEEFNDCCKWYADYLETPLYPYEFDIWQYTESGHIDGIEGNVDIDIIFIKK